MNKDFAKQKHNHRDEYTIKREMEKDPTRSFVDTSKDEVWLTLLAKDNNKFVFSHVKEGKRAHELEAALQWLKNAGLIHVLELVRNAEIPLSINADATYFKVYMSNIGLLSRRLNLSIDDYIDEKESLKTSKGAITENYVMNELIRLDKKPYYWKSGNTAEIDFIFEDSGSIIPIEVKAATNTQAKVISNSVRNTIQNMDLSYH